MSDKRNDIVDIAKGIGIFLMVIGHTGIPLPLRIWIYSFHMPLFFFISGFFYKRDKYGIGSFVKARCKTLVIPYFIFLVITFLWFRFFDLGLVYCPPLLDLLLNGTQWAIWFIPVLFITELLIVVFNNIARKISANFVFYIMVIICIVMSYMAYLFNIHLPYKVEVCGMAMVYYWIGYFMKCMAPDFINKKMGIFIVIHILACLVFHPSTEMSFNNWDMGILNIVIALMGILGIFFLSKNISKLEKISMLVISLGEYSLVVLGLSQPYYQTVNKLFKVVAFSSSCSFIIRQMILWLALIGSILIIKKYAPWIIGKRT